MIITKSSIIHQVTVNIAYTSLKKQVNKKWSKGVL